MSGKFDEKKIRQPLIFSKDGKPIYNKPLVKLENGINGTTKFAILKTTDGGKYMRGNTLFYSINGVEIYTEENNIIFVDLGQKTVWIKEYEKALNEINPKTPEEKEYILLYTDIGYEDTTSEDEFPLRWEGVLGRSAAYENIKINAPVIDIDKSYVLVETVAFKDALTVRQFIEYLKNANIIDEESFDINDFSGSDYI